METPEKKPEAAFGELLYKVLLPKLEWISLLVVVAGIALWWLAGQSAALVIGLSTLAAAFFLFGFQPPPPDFKEGRLLPLLKLHHIAGAVAAASLLLYFVNADSSLLMIGALASGATSALVLVAMMAQPTVRSLFQSALLRVLPVTALALYLWIKTLSAHAS